MTTWITPLKPLMLSITTTVLLALNGYPVIAADASIELGAPFRDNAILQRGMNVPVWGWSKPGTKVTVEFASQKKSAVCGKDGKFMVWLDPLSASFEPTLLKVSTIAPPNQVEVRNVLVGEVWMASGQSNMEEPAKNTNVGKILIKGIQENVEQGNETMPIIREARVVGNRSDLSFSGFRTSPYPLERVPAGWTDGSDFNTYSSIAFAFAYDLFRELNVPIGILNCSVGATNLESWIPHDALGDATTVYGKGLSAEVKAIYPGTPEQQQAWRQYDRDMRLWINRSRQQLARHIPPDEPPNPPGGLEETRNGVGWMYNAMMHPFIPFALRGAIWNQGYNNRLVGLNYYDGLMTMIPGWRKAWNRPDLPVYLHSWFAGKSGSDSLDTGATTEMRLSTWLATRDLPHTRMASMTDITGALHYQAKTVPGRRFARLALKYQYPSTPLRAGGLAKEMVADGPTFKSYRIEGNRVIVSFDHAEAGLVVAKTSAKTAFSNPEIIEDGDDNVTMFYVADQQNIWHRAQMRIDGENVVVSSETVTKPGGVAYGSLQGNMPGLYNKALLPTTPFISLNHTLFTTRSHPDIPLIIAGRDDQPQKDPIQAKYSRLSLLASQYREDAVIQADQPTTFWGDAPGGSVVTLDFGGVKKSVQVPPKGRGWEITVPPRTASAEPLVLKVSCKLDGNMIHQKVLHNIVMGDVWYVSTVPLSSKEPRKGRKKTKGGDTESVRQLPNLPDVRIFTPFTRKRTNPAPFRYRLEASGTTRSQFYSRWQRQGDVKTPLIHESFAFDLGAAIHAKTGKPVGIILMVTKSDKVTMSSWTGGAWLKTSPSLQADYAALKLRFPLDDGYLAACESLLGEWNDFWADFDKTPPGRILSEKVVPEGASPFNVPRLATDNTSKTEATGAYNMLVCAFGQTNVKGILCLTPRSFVESTDTAHFPAEFSAMANSWKDTFASMEDPCFFYTLPGKRLAPTLAKPAGIKGKSHALSLNHWLKGSKESMAEQLDMILKTLVSTSYSDTSDSVSESK